MNYKKQELTFTLRLQFEKRTYFLENNLREQSERPRPGDLDRDRLCELSDSLMVH